MTREEAFGLLGLNHSASADEIQSRFRELAKLSHPDNGGSAENMAQLINARNIVLGVSPSMALVPLEEMRSLVSEAVAAVARNYEVKESKKATVERLRQSSTLTLRQQKRVSGALGACSGILSLVGLEFVPALQNAGFVQSYTALGFATLAVLLGLYYLGLSSRIERLSAKVEDFLESLDDPEICLELLARILPEEYQEKTWSRLRLQDFIEVWRRSFERPQRDSSRLFSFRELLTKEEVVDQWSAYRNLARYVEPSELAKLLLEAGTKSGVVTASRQTLPNGTQREVYAIVELGAQPERSSGR